MSFQLGDRVISHGFTEGSIKWNDIVGVVEALDTPGALDPILTVRYENPDASGDLSPGRGRFYSSNLRLLHRTPKVERVYTAGRVTLRVEVQS